MYLCSGVEKIPSHSFERCGGVAQNVEAQNVASFPGPLIKFRSVFFFLRLKLFRYRSPMTGHGQGKGVNDAAYFLFFQNLKRYREIRLL